MRVGIVFLGVGEGNVRFGREEDRCVFGREGVVDVHE
jgi:hypothetical protein